MSADQTSKTGMLWWALALLLVISLAVAVVVYLIHLAYQARLDLLRTTLLHDSFLSGTPCAPPCWHGIVPGETSRSQALQRLEDHPYIRTSSLEEAGTSERGGVLWLWREATGTSVASGVSWEDDIVQEIRLGLPPGLTVEQVVERFGAPEAVKVAIGGVPEHTYYIIDLYYPGAGIQFDAYTREGESALEPSTRVTAVLLFVPTTLEQRVLTEYGEGSFSHIMGIMRPWQGYGELFEIYYESLRELEG